MVICSYGGGTNSTAMLIELRERGEALDAVVFADTGGEKPETYDYLKTIDDWLHSNGMPRLTIVRKVKRDGSIQTLEQNCLESKMLPSLAYGFKSCSQKFKIAPQDKWANNNPAVRAVWDRGERVTKLIGYDMDERHRWENKDWSDAKYIYRAPLVEWNMGRDECVDTIRRAGLPLPGKSSCFFCPASKKPEIVQLYKKHPDLVARAIAMENNAELTTVKGLGRRFAWRDFIYAEQQQSQMFPDSGLEIDCGCYDG
jgi:hypothetical protein